MSSGAFELGDGSDPSGFEAPPRSEREDPDLDTIFGTLQNSRRRAVIRYLARESETTTSDLAEYIACLENDVSRESLDSAQRKTVYVSLYQSHLPKLDDVGAIAYDSDRGTMTRGDSLTAFVEILEHVDETGADDGGPRRRDALTGAAFIVGSLAVAVVGAALVTAGQLSTSDAGSAAFLAASLALFASGSWLLARTDSGS